MGNALGFAGLVVAATAMALWTRALIAVRVPADRTGYIAANATAALLGAASFAAGSHGAGAWAGGIALASSAVFLLLQSLSGQDRKKPAVAAGGPVIDFEATDDGGAPFRLESLRGRPFLLKFFRGHW